MPSRARSHELCVGSSHGGSEEHQAVAGCDVGAVGSPVCVPGAGPVRRGTSLPEHSPGWVLCLGIAATAASSITTARFWSAPVVKCGLLPSHLS